MIFRNLHISKYDWDVNFYFALDTYYIDNILKDLLEIDCPESLLDKILNNLLKNTLNTGFTYSNLHKTVTVTALTSSPKQMLNSIAHEIRHLVDDIANECNLDLDGEDVGYLTGEIFMYLFNDIKDLTNK